MKVKPCPGTSCPISGEKGVDAERKEVCRVKERLAEEWLLSIVFDMSLKVLDPVSVETVWWRAAMFEPGWLLLEHGGCLWCGLDVEVEGNTSSGLVCISVQERWRITRVRSVERNSTNFPLRVEYFEVTVKVIYEMFWEVIAGRPPKLETN